MTTQVSRDKNGVKETVSNPRRFSYVLGPKAKVNTPTKYLIAKGKIGDLNDLKERFSLEVVNKDFYAEISNLFTKLTGGTHTIGRAKKEYKAMIQLPSVPEGDQRNLEFTVRLIGRVIFCWFLREKKSAAGLSLMPRELLSQQAVSNQSDYYHSILEPIFFEVLNKHGKSRREQYATGPFATIPYLNGGLFSPSYDDYFSYNTDKQSIFHNTVIIPDEWLVEFISFLETYNFTIDENVSFDEELSIDPEMLGRIFENLLAEISPETGESARKRTGSYYTPRSIVDYMVDEALFSYLKSQTALPDEKLRAIISYDLDDDTEHPLSAEEYNKIVNSLSTIKILDPACGSGAFPIGALQKIVFILQQADPDGRQWFEKQIANTSPEIKRVIEREFANKNFNYIRKRGVIRENIFGVDIQPIATEISRLRCFLTLIVDESIHDELENRGVEPLPNLDFKFVTANTLVQLPGKTEQSLFKDQKRIDQLRDLRNQFFGSTNSERQQLQLDFKEIQNQMLNRMIELGGADEITRTLSTWNPFSHNATPWFDPEWMFGVRDFNVVIGNPPYVFARNSKSKGLSKEQKDFYYENFKLAKYQINLYALFLEKSTTLLDDKGVLSFIVPNNWLTINTNKDMREFILGFSNVVIVNFYARVFVSASVDSSVIVFSNGTHHHEVSLYEYDDDQKLQLIKKTDTSYFLKKTDAIINISALKNTEVGELVEKIESRAIPLNKLADVKAGLQAYEVGKGTPAITETMKDERVYHSAEKKDDSYYKYLDGRDVQRYSFGWSGDYLKYGNNLSAPRNFHLFSTPRILVRQIPSQPPYCIPACYTEETILNDRNSMNVVNIKDDPLFLLGVLNSKIITFWFIHKFGKLQRGIFPQFKINELEGFPIPNVSPEKKAAIAKLAARILFEKKKNIDADTTELESCIDDLVLDAFDLTEKERALIRSEALPTAAAE